MRHTAATLALAFAAAPLLAQDHAVPRGGGSSGGGSSSSGAGHTSSGSSSSGGSGSSSSSGGSSGSSSSSSSSGTAERRHPRAGTGTGNRYNYYGGGGYGGGYYGGYYPWYPWYYPSSYSWGPYWGSYYYGYWPQGAYYTGGYSRSYRSSSGEETGAVRVLVDPEDAKVYVDGYYAGTVDDFDGFSQRLYVARGPHEILLKRQGYRSQRIRVYVVPGETLKVEHDMEKGEGEERLQDLTGGRGDSSDGRYSPDPRSSAPDDREDSEGAEDAPPPQRPSRDDAGVDVGRGGGPGTLALRVWPADASVYVDGEFRGTGRQLRTLQMTPGSHRVEIVRPGFPTFQREVEIRAGRTEDLQVTLEQP